MAKEMVVTNGLIGTVEPSASRMPPTAETTANPTLSTGASTGEAVTRIAAAAGVTSRERTSSAPTICTASAPARASSSAKVTDSTPAGTPRATATSGSADTNISGRQITTSPGQHDHGNAGVLDRLREGGRSLIHRAQRVEQVERHRLGDRHAGSLRARPVGGLLLGQRLQAPVEGGRVGPERRRIAGVGRGQGGGDPVGDLAHGGEVVPDMLVQVLPR